MDRNHRRWSMQHKGPQWLVHPQWRGPACPRSACGGGRTRLSDPLEQRAPDQLPGSHATQTFLRRDYLRPGNITAFVFIEVALRVGLLNFTVNKNNGKGRKDN